MVDKTQYILRLKDIYRQKTGSELSDAEALEYWEKLVLLVRIVYQPMARNAYGIQWTTVQ